MEQKILIRFDDVSFSYDDDEQQTPAVEHISFEVNKGEFVAVLGRNGSGKSTVAKLSNSIYIPSSGKVTVDGDDTSVAENELPIRKKVGVVFQNPDNQIVASIVEEDVAFGPENLGVEPKELRLRVDEALKSVGMYEYRRHETHRLSGGQKQRVAIAGMIAMRPRCLVLDEPTAMLDPQGRRDVMKTVKSLNKNMGMAVVFITHFMDEAVKADRIMVIDESDKSLSMADERLEEAIKKTNAKLLILDPIQAYLGGGMDMNRANEARDMTKRLGALAEKYKCAIVLIGHMNKAGGSKAAYRGMGSIDFYAVARSVLLVGRVEGEPTVRAVVQIKNNLAAFGHSKAFELTEEGFEWKGDYEITADEVLGGIVPKANKQEMAKELLRDLSEQNEMMPSSEIFELANEENISKRTLENAKKELGIKAKRIGDTWYWVLKNE